MSTPTRITPSLNSTQLAEFEKIAEAEHMKATAFAALVLAKFSDLKQGYGLAALTAIPKEYFKLRPGRHPSAATSPHLELVGNTAKDS